MINDRHKPTNTIPRITIMCKTPSPPSKLLEKIPDTAPSEPTEVPANAEAASKKWTMPIRNCSQAMNQVVILHEDRLKDYV